MFYAVYNQTTKLEIVQQSLNLIIRVPEIFVLTKQIFASIQYCICSYIFIRGIFLVHDQIIMCPEPCTGEKEIEIFINVSEISNMFSLLIIN